LALVLILQEVIAYYAAYAAVYLLALPPDSLKIGSNATIPKKFFKFFACRSTTSRARP